MTNTPLDKTGMVMPQYHLGQLITSSDNKGLVIGKVVSVKWDEKVSEYNMKCGAGFELPEENEDMWLYSIDAIARKRIIKIYEDDIDGTVEVSYG